MKRTAILLNETGEEIFRGDPANLPVRFVSEDGYLVEHSMNACVDVGTPIDEDSGNDLVLYDENSGEPEPMPAGSISLSWFTTDGQNMFLGANVLNYLGKTVYASELLAVCGKDESSEGSEGFELSRKDVENFVATYQKLAKERGVGFKIPTDLYDDFE